MVDKLKIFISCVSDQFEDCRNVLASDLRAIGCEVKVQEDFQQGSDTLISQIEAYVEQCDRVIVLVGDAYGCEAAKAAVPDTEPPRSYTQWEYYFALGERLNGKPAEAKERYVYIASQDYLDQHPVHQSSEYTAYQSEFGQMIKESGKHWAEFDSLDQLCRQALRDGWNMQQRPAQICNLPFGSLGDLFKGREEFIATLHEHLQERPGQAVAVAAKQAIHGLGGVGKTRLAIEYAWRFKAEYSALLFVSADSEAALHRNLAVLCEPKLLNLSEHEALEEDIRVAATLRWLAEHSGWLLLLDNVDTPAAAEAVKDLFGHLQEGHVLVTSRLSNWAGGIDTLELDVLEETDAVAFILQWTEQERSIQATDEADALALTRELGGLILALEQAAAFIKQRHLAIADYLARWREREGNVRERFDPSQMNYPRSVAVTWETSVAQLDEAALALLQILCWFAPEPIPRNFLTLPSAEKQLTEVLPQFAAKTATVQPDPEAALSELVGYSLVNWEDDNTAFSLHRLMAEMTSRRIDKDQRGNYLQAALNWVNEYLPSDPLPQDVRSWPLRLPMRGHLATLIEQAVAEDIAEPTASLANDLGSLLFAQGQWKAAEPLMRQSLTMYETSFGNEDSNVDAVLNNLTQLLQETNRLEEAEPLVRRALAIGETHYGCDHHNVAVLLNNLALLLLDTNRLEEADPLMRQSLEIVLHSCVTNGYLHPHLQDLIESYKILLQHMGRTESEAKQHITALGQTYGFEF